MNHESTSSLQVILNDIFNDHCLNSVCAEYFEPRNPDCQFCLAMLLIQKGVTISAQESNLNKIIDKQKAEITRLQNLSRKRGAMIGGISRRKGRNY